LSELTLPIYAEVTF